MKERSELVEKALAILHATPSRQTAAPVERRASDWRSRWRELATVTSGLLPDDPRVDPVLRALADCDRCYKTGDVDGFTQGAGRVRRLMQFVPGAAIRWDGTVNHRLMVLGPATVEHVHLDKGRLQVFVTWQGLGRWVSECIITEIRDPK